jgi:hypothetical protein
VNGLGFGIFSIVADTLEEKIEGMIEISKWKVVVRTGIKEKRKKNSIAYRSRYLLCMIFLFNMVKGGVKSNGKSKLVRIQ